MTVLQTMGGATTGTGPASGLTSTDVLLLHAQAGLQQADADDAAGAACKAIGATPVSLDSLLKDAALLAKIKSSGIAMACIKLSKTAADKVDGSAPQPSPDVDVTNADQMTALSKNETELAGFCKDAKLLAEMAAAKVNAGTLLVLQAVNKSQSLLQSVYDTVTGSGFTSSYTGYQDAPSNLDSRVASYSRCIILTATGYYSSTASRTLVYVDGTQVADGSTVNTRRPVSVSKTNIGAIALPAASFTESGDGYAAVQVMTVNQSTK